MAPNIALSRRAAPTLRKKRPANKKHFKKCTFSPQNVRTSPPPYRGLEGPEMPKKSRKCLPGPPAPEPRKVSKKSREQSKKSPESVERVFSDCSRDFLETFRRSGAGGPGRHFLDFFGISGPKGPRDLCKGAGSFATQNRNLYSVFLISGGPFFAGCVFFWRVSACLIFLSMPF